MISFSLDRIYAIFPIFLNDLEGQKISLEIRHNNLSVDIELTLLYIHNKLNNFNY